MQFDTDKIEIIAPNVWRSGHLSIARHYGGCCINGRKYIHDTETDFLVREDVYKRNLVAKKKAKAEARRAAAARQNVLFG